MMTGGIKRSERYSVTDSLKSLEGQIMKILLTGATGFLGSHLLEALLAHGHQVTILKRSSSDTSRIAHLTANVESYDIDRVPLEMPFQQSRIQAVIHTATCYGRSNDTASEIVQTNLLFPLKLLEISSTFQTETFFNTDTFFTLFYQYLSHYTLSKRQFAEWLKLFCATGKIRGVNMKVEHMYGPKDSPEKFIPWLLKQLLNNVDHIPMTPGEQKRDFIYISDVVSAYLLLLSRQDQLPQFTELEVGTGRAVSIRNFALRMQEAVAPALEGRAVTRFDFGALPYRTGEFMETKADISQLIDMGWAPKFSVKRGIDALVKWELLTNRHD